MEQEANYFEILDNLNSIETCIKKTKTLKELRNKNINIKLLAYVYNNEFLKIYFNSKLKEVEKISED